MILKNKKFIYLINKKKKNLYQKLIKNNIFPILIIIIFLKKNYFLFSKIF